MTPQCKSWLIKAGPVAGVCSALVILAYAVRARQFAIEHWEEENDG